jgi:putative SOS response-associated peptidase YedK
VSYSVKEKPTLVTNARDDQLAKIRLWKESVGIRRCLIPVVGYFEPRPGPVVARGEVLFTMRDRPVFFIAGLWDADPDGAWAYAMVTTSPNAYTALFHDRQPVALSDRDALSWLGATPLAVEQVARLTRPGLVHAMDTKEVRAFREHLRACTAAHLTPEPALSDWA